MSDEDTSLVVHVGTVATAESFDGTSAIGRCTNDIHGTSTIINNKRPPGALEMADNCTTTTICIGSTTLSNDITVNNDYNNECEQVDLTLTIPTSTTRSTTMAAVARRPNPPPTVIFTMPSIAVTSATADSATASPIPATTKRTCKRTGKIDFVRFDSVETIYKQTDHDDVIRRAVIKDEIKK